MSLARAFTMRASKRDTSSTPPLPIRTGSVKVPGKAIDRNLISHPVALLSTTNMLSYNAPDISSLKSLRKASSSVSSGSSHASADDSDESSRGNGSRNTYQTDSSSVDNSPTTSTGNDDSVSYFSIKSRKSTPRRSISTSDLRNRTPSSPSPEIPHRAPSHSKKAHERVARKSASQQLRLHSSTHSWLSVPTAREQRTSLEILSNKADSTHPFGKELKQLDEVAEEFNDTIENIDREADADVMKKQNLGKFCAEEYLAEIRPLYLRCFEPKLLAVGPGGWI